MGADIDEHDARGRDSETRPLPQNVLPRPQWSQTPPPTSLSSVTSLPTTAVPVLRHQRCCFSSLSSGPDGPEGPSLHCESQGAPNPRVGRGLQPPPSLILFAPAASASVPRPRDPHPVTPPNPVFSARLRTLPFAVLTDAFRLGPSGLWRASLPLPSTVERPEGPGVHWSPALPRYTPRGGRRRVVLKTQDRGGEPR